MQCEPTVQECCSDLLEGAVFPRELQRDAELSCFEIGIINLWTLIDNPAN